MNITGRQTIMIIETLVATNFVCVHGCCLIVLFTVVCIVAKSVLNNNIMNTATTIFVFAIITSFDLFIRRSSPSRLKKQKFPEKHALENGSRVMAG
jgi:hypothetical protein